MSMFIKMRPFLCYLPFFILFNIGIKAQSVDISVNVLQSFLPQAKLYIHRGTELELIDSVYFTSPGVFQFTLHPGYQQGLYKVNIGKGISLDVVVADEPLIDASTVVYAPNDSLKSMHSKENALYWEYLNVKKQQEQLGWLIGSLMDFYPDSTVFYHLLSYELDSKKKEFYAWSKSIALQNSKLLASKFIKADQGPPILNHPKIGESIQQIADSWWQDFDFFDTRLLNSPHIATRLWGFIELLFNDGYDMEEQVEAFCNGISDLMQRDMDVEIKQYIRAILIDGFAKSDYLKVVDLLETTGFKGIEPIRKKNNKPDSTNIHPINIGDKAFDFIIKNPDAKQIKLSELESNYKLVFFWSTWCPHCIESIPKILKTYDHYSRKEFEIVAVAIDQEEEEWKNFIKARDLKWINIHVPYSAANEIIENYNVHETPKMYLLSNDLTVVSLPATSSQLEAKLKKLTKRKTK
ncbi:MAG TPA: TlpA disulfide reductase family protein [Tenuifilaceae bacterium]|nr:TlpA disulfide reductase family protein [Tenuifilaceae bacterium]